jgi:hypothetical protein
LSDTSTVFVATTPTHDLHDQFTQRSVVHNAAKYGGHRWIHADVLLGSHSIDAVSVTVFGRDAPRVVVNTLNEKTALQQDVQEIDRRSDKHASLVSTVPKLLPTHTLSTCIRTRGGDSNDLE